jgi:hypothetical protein
MRKTKDIIIEGKAYQLIEMPATRRSIIALELKHIFTGAGNGVKDLDSKLDYVEIIKGILDRITPEKGAYLLRDIIMNGLQFPIMKTPEAYDEEMGEFYDHQIELVTEIMAFNFGKSIEKVKKKLEKTGLLTLISSGKETEKK